MSGRKAMRFIVVGSLVGAAKFLAKFLRPASHEFKVSFLPPDATPLFPKRQFGNKNKTSGRGADFHSEKIAFPTPEKLLSGAFFVTGTFGSANLPQTQANVACGTKTKST